MEIQQKKRPWAVLLLSLLALVGIGALFLTVSPNYAFPVLSVKIPSVIFFFPLVLVFFYGLGAFLLRRAIQGILIASVMIIFFLFRFLHLTHPLFVGLLFILFLSLEAVIWKKE